MQDVCNTRSEAPPPRSNSVWPCCPPLAVTGGQVSLSLQPPFRAAQNLHQNRMHEVANTNLNHRKSEKTKDDLESGLKPILGTVTAIGGNLSSFFKNTNGFGGGHGRRFPNGVTAMRCCIGVGPVLPD